MLWPLPCWRLLPWCTTWWCRLFQHCCAQVRRGLCCANAMGLLAWAEAHRVEELRPMLFRCVCGGVVAGGVVDVWGRQGSSSGGVAGWWVCGVGKDMR